MIASLFFALPVSVYSVDFLKNVKASDLKKLVQSELTISGQTVTGFEAGIDLTGLQNLLNAQGDLWLKKTRYNEIWLENFKLDYGQGANKNRMQIGATLRYRTYTKNIFRPSRRWRTASYLIKMKGSAALGISNSGLSLGEFRVDLVDMRHFPGWAENIIKKYINRQISASIPVPFQLVGVNYGKVSLSSIVEKGSFMTAKFAFDRSIQFQVQQIPSKVKGIKYYELKGVDFAPKPVEIKADLFKDSDNRQSYGIYYKFEKVNELTNGIEFKVRKVGDAQFMRYMMYPNRGSYPMGRDTAAYEGYHFGAVPSFSSINNLPPGLYEWQARYNFKNQHGNKHVQLGKKFSTGKVTVPDYGITHKAKGTRNYLTFKPEIKKLEVLHDAGVGRVIQLDLKRPPIVFDESKVNVQLSMTRNGYSMRPHVIDPDKTFSIRLSGSNASCSTINCVYVKAGNQYKEAYQLKPGKYYINMRFYTNVMRGRGSQKIFSDALQHTFTVDADPISQPRVQAVKHEYGKPFQIKITNAQKDAEYEVAQAGVYIIRRPNEKPLVRLKPVNGIITLPTDKFNPAKKMNIGVRLAVADAKLVSEWSNKLMLTPAEKPQTPKVEGELLGKLVNDGTGNNRTKKKGGNLVSVHFSKLKGTSKLIMKPVSGSFNFVTVHARYNGGIWRVAYRGKDTEIDYNRYFKNAENRNATHLIMQLNGANERYSPAKGEVEVYLVKGNAPTDTGDDNAAFTKIGDLKNDGTGNNRTKKKGGNVFWYEFKNIKGKSKIKVNVKSGTYKYLTIHARYPGGIWRTVYRGSDKVIDYNRYLKPHESRASHIVVQLNGANERFEPAACTAELLVK